MSPFRLVLTNWFTFEQRLLCPAFQKSVKDAPAAVESRHGALQEEGVA